METSVIESNRKLCDVIAALLKVKTNILNVRGLFSVYFEDRHVRYLLNKYGAVYTKSSEGYQGKVYE